MNKYNRIINVLIIEDDPIQIRLIKNIFGKSSINFNITIAETFQDSLISLDSRTYDLVILDLILPDSPKNWRFTMAQVKAAAKDASIVLVTSTKLTQTEILEVEADGYIHKPDMLSDPTTLVEEIAIAMHLDTFLNTQRNIISNLESIKECTSLAAIECKTLSNTFSTLTL